MPLEAKTLYKGSRNPGLTTSYASTSCQSLHPTKASKEQTHTKRNRDNYKSPKYLCSLSSHQMLSPFMSDALETEKASTRGNATS